MTSINDTSLAVYLFPVANSALFVQKVGLVVTSAYRPVVLRISLTSYVMNADSDR